MGIIKQEARISSSQHLGFGMVRDGPVRAVEVFERAWRRGFATITGRRHLSDPPTWPLGLEADNATLTVDVSDTKVLGGSGTVFISVQFEDSADGVLWSPLGPLAGVSNPSGAYRLDAQRPFGAWLRVRLDIGASGTGTLGLADLQGTLSLRRVHPYESLSSDPELAPYMGPISADAYCACGCGGTCGCGEAAPAAAPCGGAAKPSASAPAKTSGGGGCGCGG